MVAKPWTLRLLPIALMLLLAPLPGAAQQQSVTIDYTFDEARVDSEFTYAGSTLTLMEYDCGTGPFCGTYSIFLSVYFYEDFLGYGRKVTNVTPESSASVGWSDDSTMNDQQSYCRIDAFDEYFVQTTNFLHTVYTGGGWDQYPADYPSCAYRQWARPRTGIVDWAGSNGVFGITPAGSLIRKHWTTSWTTTPIPHWGGDLVVGSLIQGTGTGTAGNVFGVNESGRMFTTYVTGGVVTFALVPGTFDLDPHSLALSNGNGVFGVKTSGELVRAYWAGTGWANETIPHWGGDLVPSSLLTGGGSGLAATIYGVNENGQVFTVYNPGSGPTFALIPHTARIHPDSLVYTDGNGLFGIDAVNGELKHIYWGGGGWNVDTIPHWGPDLEPVSLIPGTTTGPNANIYGVNAAGQMFTTYKPGGVVTFAIVPGTSGLDPESLAPTAGKGVFGVQTDGDLVRSYWTGGGWVTELIPHWGPPIVPESLIAGWSTGAYANIYGVNRAGQLITTYNPGGVVTFAIVP
ncbi:MAG: hypothetical protein MI919_37675 [Holophagales bacterium]|nr:hypothetical protein [Holophagales bacterium]